MRTSTDSRGSSPVATSGPLRETCGTLAAVVTAKAAANQQVKTLDLDFKRASIPVMTLAFEPGFIKTRLTNWRGHVDIEEFCTGMVDVIERMTPEQSGTFLNWKGEALPW